MSTDEMIARWKAEENVAHIHGWDFSHIDGRYAEAEDLPWNYRETIMRYLKREMRILEQNGCMEGKIHRFLLVARK